MLTGSLLSQADWIPILLGWLDPSYARLVGSVLSLADNLLSWLDPSFFRLTGSLLSLAYWISPLPGSLFSYADSIYPLPG
jgi:hypothetical protein